MQPSTAQRGSAICFVIFRAHIRARRLKQIAQQISRRKQYVDDIRRGKTSVPDRIQHGFKHMRELDQPLITKNAGTALDRVRRAKNSVDRLLRTARPRRSSHSIAELFAAFHEESS